MNNQTRIDESPTYVPDAVEQRTVAGATLAKVVAAALLLASFASMLTASPSSASTASDTPEVGIEIQSAGSEEEAISRQANYISCYLNYIGPYTSFVRASCFNKPAGLQHRAVAVCEASWGRYTVYGRWTTYSRSWAFCYSGMTVDYGYYQFR